MSTQTGENKDTHSKQQINQLVIGLIVLASMAIGSRLLLIGPSQLATGDRLWRLTIDVTAQTSAQATAVQIHPPLETGRLRIIQRNLQHPGFRIRNWGDDKLERRSILAFATGNGQHSITAKFFIHHQAGPTLPTEIKAILLTNTQREKYLQDTSSLQLTHPLVTQTLQNLNQQQSDRNQLVNDIFNYLQLFTTSYKKDELNVPTTLAAKKATTLDRALTMVALCRAAGFPARVVTGLILKEDIDPRPYYWVGVYQNEKWLNYDIPSGYRETVPVNYLPLRRDGADIVQVLNGELSSVDYDLEREFDHPYLHQHKSKSIFDIFDLSRLPLDARNELAILLLLPLGALITAMCRHLVGLHSYGVFTPTLLALAMVYTDVLTTMLIFIVVSALAIGGRSLFPTSITRVPRLAIIFTLVAMILTFSASVMDYYELGQGGRIVLLPIIILTSLVDRLYRTIEDKGLTIAMHRLAWTVLISLLCLPVVQFESLGHVLLQYPEIHLMTLSLFLLISLYKGKQLINLPFVKWLAEPESKKKKTSAKQNTDEANAS